MSQRPHKTPTAPKLPRPPRWIIYLVIIMVVASWIPLGLIAVARTSPSPKPRVHIFQDMDVAMAYKPQDASPLFQDARAMRLPVAGTIARGELFEDDFYFRGYATDPATGQTLMAKAADGTDTKQYFDGYPPQVKLTRALLERGRTQYNIFCAICHGDIGYGDGMVHLRVQQINSLAAATGQPLPAQAWVQPRNLHEERIVKAKPAYLYDIITNGINKMAPYASQIPVADRWAIVAYVQALQVSQNYPASKLQGNITPQELPDGAARPIAAAEPPSAEAVAQMAEPANVDDPALIAKGKQLWMMKTCMACHQTPDYPTSPPLGPPFKTSPIGQKVQVTEGVGGPVKEVTFDYGYFVESVLNPMAKIAVNKDTNQPYQPIMVLPPPPPTDEEIAALWAYLKSIESK